MKPIQLCGIALVFSAVFWAGCQSGSSAGGDTDSSSTRGEAALPEKGPENTNPFYDHLARYLAGMPLPDNHALPTGWDSLADWQQHQDFWNQAWATKDSALLQKLAKWAAQEFPKAHDFTGTAYYPLSGGDFMNIYPLFPKAQQFVFFGLEPEGRLVDTATARQLTLPEVTRSLQNQRAALDDVFRLTFFVTRDMQRELGRARFNGQFPILLAFMARHDQEILAIQPIRLKADGSVDADVTQPAEFVADDEAVTGLRYTFRKRTEHNNAPIKTLDYWSLDIQDKILTARYPQFLTYIESHAPTVTYFKAASYLFHWDIYSALRKSTQKTSDFILQDDSGIALRFFNRDTTWHLQFYGQYDKPKLEVWGGYQPALKQIYRTDTTIKPIDFGLGYTNQKHNCNLMVARKQQGYFQ